MWKYIPSSWISGYWEPAGFTDFGPSTMAASAAHIRLGSREQDLQNSVKLTFICLISLNSCLFI